MKMILITRLERDHLLSILKECQNFAYDMPEGWAVADLAEGGLEILESLEATEVQIPDG